MKSQLPARNAVLLLITAIIWGTSFVAQRVGMDYMGAFTFSAVRFCLGGLFLIPVLLFLGRKREAPSAETKKTTRIGGLVCGVIVCVMANLQQFAVVHTTVGKTGFITALYIILVPIVSLFFGRKAGKKLWLAVGIAVLGLYLLCMTESFSLGFGDTLVCICALVCTAHILAVDHFVVKVDGVTLACLQFFVASFLSAILMLIFEGPPAWSTLVSGGLPLLYSGILVSGVAYTLQILGQKGANPTAASLIMSLESVIAALSGWLLLNQSMTIRELFGAALMFVAIILAQLPDKKKQGVPPPDTPPLTE